MSNNIFSGTTSSDNLQAALDAAIKHAAVELGQESLAWELRDISGIHGGVVGGISTTVSIYAKPIAGVAFAEFSPISCVGLETREWEAVQNLMPPKPDQFYVTGRVCVPNSGIRARLVPTVPQGKHSNILMLDLILTQDPISGCSEPGCIPVRYDQVIQGPQYTQVEILCEGKVIETINVQDVS